MEITIITKEELVEFKNDFLKEIEKLLMNNKEKISRLQNGRSPIEKRWMKSNEARKLLNISPGTFHKLKTNGIVPYSRIGKVCLYDYEEIVKLIQSNKIIKTLKKQ